MVERVFCIGNGESRQSIDLIKLRPHGKIYGCNGLYRDFKPDVLTAVDGPMMHEVYQSGYDGELWLRDWNPVPGMTYSSVVFAGLTPEEIEIGKNIYFRFGCLYNKSSSLVKFKSEILSISFITPRVLIS